MGGVIRRSQEGYSNLFQLGALSNFGSHFLGTPTFYFDDNLSLISLDLNHISMEKLEAHNFLWMSVSLTTFSAIRMDGHKSRRPVTKISHAHPSVTNKDRNLDHFQAQSHSIDSS